MNAIPVMRKPLVGLLLVVVMLFAATMSASAQVTPSEVEATLERGESLEVNKEVQTPAFPPVLDFCLLVDNSGSYIDDLPTIKALAPSIFGDVRAEVTDSEFCLATFVDFPISPFGAAGDYEYHLDQDLTTDQTTWVSAVNAMVTLNGADEPESQLEALNRMAVGPNAPSWRANATRVIAITTDASFHDPLVTDPAYPGPTFATVAANLNAAGIRVIAIKAPGASTQMDDIANATGGSVQSTGSSSAEIADAIIAGLSNLPITVTPVAVGCDPLLVDFVPASSTVTSGDPANFVETITVPDDPSLEGTTIECTVEFRDNGTVIAVQEITIHVADTTAPEVACVETVNPNGNNVPAAPGRGGQGQNQDGFYQLLATDNVDASVGIWVTSTGPSGATFGPFASGDNVKITQANGATPSMQQIGSANGNAGAVVTHLILDGDAMITATDAAGNTGTAVCLVPPQPK